MAADLIQLRGVRVHNLKGVDVDIPLRRLTVLTGVSGAGKSSLVFDTLHAEAQRRYLQSFSAYTRQFLERLEKPDAELIGPLPPAIGVAQRGSPRGPRATVGTLTEVVDYLRLLFARVGEVFCRKCRQPVRAHQPQDIVRETATLPAGTRFAVAFPAHPDKMRDDWAADLKEEGYLRVQIGNQVFRLGEEELPPVDDKTRVWVLVDRLEAGKNLERLNDSIETALARGEGRLALLLDGSEVVFDQRLVCPRCDIVYPPLEPRLFSFNDPLGACPECEGTGLSTRGRMKDGEVCAACGGTRLSENAGIAQLGGETIASLPARTLSALATFFADVQLSEEQAAGKVLIEQIKARLRLLLEVRLGYLSLDRSAATLSTGEARRIRLAAALGSSLVHALYLLDEPTAGLHPRDTAGLLAVLRRLRDQGNTVVLVEHDAEAIAEADHVVDLGPGAGEEGGEVLYQGPPAGLAGCAESVTGQYLAGSRFVGVPSRRRKVEHGTLRLLHARTNNLQDLTVEFPLGVLCTVTGVSGAGKSSLVEQTLYPALCRRLHKKCEIDGGAEVHGAGQISDVVLMDQAPLPRTARSNPATYLKVFDEIRAVFADTSEARIRNFGPSTFSFNQAGGRCDACEGQGILTVDMQFLADVSVTCPECHGTRFKREVLQVKVRNLSIAEVLGLSAREAFRFFRAQPLVERRLKWLLDVGLDYVRLGQPLETLSGGECQRLKLAGHLASTRKPRCLFLLLEPTAGLHLADITRLLDSFDRLLETGHSLIVVEHHLEVIKCADYLIDLGPEAGGEGGRVVATGTPEEVARSGTITGQYLRRALGQAV